MSFDKDYKNRKDHRKKYYDSRRVSRQCRNHGSCDYCKRNRTKWKLKMPEVDEWADEKEVK